MKITKISDNGVSVLAEVEGCILQAYVDPATGGLPITIGVGSTHYKDGRKIKLGETLTKTEAYQLVKDTISTYEQAVDASVRDDINQNQFDALVLLCYNIGPANFKSSTVAKRVNINPNDVVGITQAYLMWNKAAGKVMKGLTNRRMKELELYFK